MSSIPRATPSPIHASARPSPSVHTKVGNMSISYHMCSDSKFGRGLTLWAISSHSSSHSLHHSMKWLATEEMVTSSHLRRNWQQNCLCSQVQECFLGVDKIKVFVQSRIADCTFIPIGHEQISSS